MRSGLLPWLMSSMLLMACDTTPSNDTIRLSGRVNHPDGALPGPIHLIAYQAWSLDGELRHPLQHITSWQSETAEFDYLLEYPSAHGEGLVVYAWLDKDGDGVHCTPTKRDELAGLAEATLTADNARVTIDLTTACAAANWFYPPAE